MARLLQFAICERCIVDARSNNASLINIIEEVHPKTFPATVTFTFFSNWEREETPEVIVNLVAYKPDNTPIEGFDLRFTISFTTPRNRLISGVTFRLEDQGKHSFEIRVSKDGGTSFETAGRVFLNVTLRT